MLPSPWPPPTSPPVSRSGWYRANDGGWYVSSVPPADGYWLSDDGEWHPPMADDERWRISRWGLGDFWWGVLAFLVAGIVGGLIVAGVIAARDPDRSIEEVEFGPYATGVLVLINAVAFFGVPWLATRRKGLRSLAADFGLRVRPLDLAIGFGLGIAALIGAAVASNALDAALDPAEETSNVPLDSLDGTPAFVVFLVAVGMLTPIIEELFFRGLVYRSFLKRGSRPLIAGTLTTLIFVVPHLVAVSTWENALTLAAAIGIIGVVLNLACHLTGNRLAAPIVAHMVVNGTAAIALFVT